MSKVKAVGFYEHLPIKNTHSFEDVMTEVKSPEEHDLLVKVDGISVNPVDTFIRRGGRHNKLVHPKVIGWDAVGTVTQVGSSVSLFKVGDRVWYAGDFTRQGSDAREQLVDERIVGYAPTSLKDRDAAGIPLVGLTAYESLFEKLHIDEKDVGKSILIINGSGGVGSIAIQLAKLAGLRVIATASRPESIKWVEKLGADFVVNHHANLVKQVRKVGFKYVDYILNLSNLDAHWNEISELIKPDGCVAASTENRRLIDLQKLTKKRVTFSWEWMYSKSYYQLEDMISQHHILNRLSNLFDEGKLVPITTKSYTPIDASNMQKAHSDVESGKMIGKVTLTGWE
ncbi:zinc-containing alcohol dehydrogenase [Fructobacillus fructosus]|uniref:zinc-binding alcohol dehydrogenase family protein n=1 Tax=Fructobacillus fructosus TaxID=1631 RepID=UPI00067528B6|nr:zinc-binding alcohol dehydrogenase family protein [Fructobacillus fructosus]KRN52634.1 oxidoreductase [Fructobacillus fructosus KCTC 3544]GAP01969.1 zinc-containing alcohol dehydrogenase [Fructobacillus fructosus]